MPTYRDITIGLCSQYDIAAVPEFVPPALEGHPPLQVNEVVSVYMPILPASQFWVCYKVDEPEDLCPFYYFKLYVDGTHAVSWGCGKQDHFKGKAMFALFDGRKLLGKAGQVEKRALFFPSKQTMPEISMRPTERYIEIQVFRAKGRKRVPREVTEVPGGLESNCQQGLVELFHAGQVKKGHPKRFYKYALTDPTDRPYVTFRYFYKSWEELGQLGVIGADDFEKQGTEEDNLSNQSMPLQTSRDAAESNLSTSAKESMVTSYDGTKGPEEGLLQAGELKSSTHARYWTDETEAANDNLGAKEPWTKTAIKRLSFPPSIKLRPSTHSDTGWSSPTKEENSLGDTLQGSMDGRSGSSLNNLFAGLRDAGWSPTPSSLRRRPRTTRRSLHDMVAATLGQ